MFKLALGILLGAITHLLPALAVDFRRKLVDRMGENPYKGLFALLTFAAIWLIVSGWKSVPPANLYLPPEWGRHAAALLVLLGWIGFFAPYPPNNIKRLLRHPQLTGVVFWGVGHLLANGESRSIVLFGGLTVWAVLEILLINRREGERSKPPAAPLKNDVLLVIFAVAVYAVFAFFAHPWLFGVSPFA
jgi:uncharacterized membrane protein